ncbi:MAG: hypothetical protein ABIE22_01750 [archaeon]
MKFNFRKVTSVLASAVMLGSTVGIAAAASYPAPFVSGGDASVAVVYGSSAAISDLSSAVDVGQNLQFHLASQTAQGGAASSGVSASGEAVQLRRSSDEFNLGDSANVVFVTALTKDHLKTLLADGTYKNDENTEFKYTQKIELGNKLNLSLFSDDGYKEDVPTVGFHLDSSVYVMNYTIDFTTNPESDVSSSDLVDLENTDINMMGKGYFIIDAKNNTGSNRMKLTLLDSANTAVITEGEPSTVDVSGNSYDVSITHISSSSVKLSINGEETNSLAAGGTYKLSDGTYIGIKELLYNAKDTGISKVEISIGTGQLVLEDSQPVELNSEDVTELTAWITRGSLSSTKETIDKIVITWTTDDEEFIAADQDLTLPGFESVKLTMGEFFTPAEESFEVSPNGNTEVRLNNFPFADGIKTLSLIYANSTGDYVGFGKESSNLLVTANVNSILFNETKGDEEFVASWNTTTEGESYLLKCTNIGTRNSLNRTDIYNQVTASTVCQDLAATDTCTVGNVVLTVNSVVKDGTIKTVNVSVNSGGSFNRLYTKEGLELRLPYYAASGIGAYNTTGNSTDNDGTYFGKWILHMTEEDKDSNLGKGLMLNVTLDDTSDSKVTVSTVSALWSGANTYEDGDSDIFIGRVKSDLATKSAFDTGGDQDKVTITYSGDQSYADVFVASPSATVSQGGGSGGGSVSELGSVTVSDSEVSQVSSKNLIIIGGSCINSAAAKFLGSDSAVCGEAFTTQTDVAAGQFLIEAAASPYNADKVAMLVAGYEAADTQNAAKYLTTQTVTTDVGTKYKGTSATSAELVTS